MSRRVLVVVGVVLMVAVLGVSLVATTFADEATEAETLCGRRGWGFGLWGRTWSVFDAAAEALGLSPEGLFSELHGGKTLDEVAEEKGVDLEAVRDAVQAVRSEAAKEAIQQAVEDGRLTQEQADWLLKGLELGFPLKGGHMGGRGWGGGRLAFGLRGGRGPVAPSTSPSATVSLRSL